MKGPDFNGILLEGTTFCGCDGPLDQSRLVIFGAPYDGSASFRPGARFGPSAMRQDSWGLESYSPYQDRDLTEVSVSDLGDLELGTGPAEAVLKRVEAISRVLIQSGKVPVMVGGDHSLTLGAFRAALEAFPDLHLIQLDAHTDLRSDYMGDPFSHASVIRRCHDLVGDGRIHSLGIRSGLKEEFDFAKKHLDFHPFLLDGAEGLARSLAGVPVYVTLDLDLLDPAVLPGTGTPEAGGPSYADLIRALSFLASLRVVATDLMELAPSLDPSGVSTAVACKVLREWLLMIG